MTPTHPGNPSNTPATLFTLLYAVAVLLHIAWTPIIQRPPALSDPALWLLGALVGTAGAVIHRPAAGGRLLALAGVQLLDVTYSLPVVPNHWLLTGMVSLTILGAGGGVMRRGRRRTVELGELYQSVGPSVRWTAVCFYFFCFFHKLNADFLNPSVSCAVRFLEHTLAPFGAVGLATLPGVGAGIITATLLSELGVAVGLAVPQWRARACLLGAGFHLVLALDAAHVFYNFSAVMYAVLWVCLPVETAARLARRVGGRTGRGWFLGSYAAVVTAAWWVEAGTARVLAFGLSAVWLAFALTLLSRGGLLGRCNVLHYGRAGKSASARERRTGKRRRAAASGLLLVPILVVLNGLAPYMGLKTRTAWQMYSNLNLSASRSNHLIVPSSLDLGGFLADSARILATSDPALHTRFVLPGHRITWFELRRALDERPIKELTYVRPRAGGNLPEEAPRKTARRAVLEKLLIFRPLGLDAGKVCDW